MTAGVEPAVSIVMPGRPSISVVMSVYDDAALLGASIDSVLAQTFGDFEFIIVNDGSPDERTAAMLDAYARADRRIRVLTKTNAGLTRALIDGCAQARGACVARLDVGDRMLPERLARQHDILARHSGTAFVSCWTEYCGPAWEPLFVRRGVATPEGGMAVLPESADGDLRAGPTHHGSVMFRRAAYEAAGGYRAAFYYGQDWDLWYRLAEQGAFAMVPSVLYQARYLAGGLSAANRGRQRALGRLSREAMRLRRLHRSEADCLRRAAAIRPHRGWGRPQTAEAGVCYLVGEALRRRGDGRSVGYLQRALRLRPWHVATWVRLAQALLRRKAS